MEIDTKHYSIPNISADPLGRKQRALHASRLKSDPSYAQRWRITNALAKDKARRAAERPKVSLPRLAFLEKPELD